MLFAFPRYVDIYTQEAELAMSGTVGLLAWAMAMTSHYHHISTCWVFTEIILVSLNIFEALIMISFTMYHSSNICNEVEVCIKHFRSF